MLTIKERLQMKTMRIEEIKDTLKRSQMLTRASGLGKEGATAIQEQDVIDEVVKEYENQEIDEEEMPVDNDDDDEDSQNELINGEENEDEDEDDDGMDNGLEEVDPQILKL
jgi:hypothetical protein